MRTEAPGRNGPFVIDDDLLAPHRAALAGAGEAPVTRHAYAAAHVAMKPSYRDADHALDRPGRPEEIAGHIDWDATMAVRRFLDAQGLGVAEAMDTAQRFFLGWSVAERLIRECGRRAPHRGFVAGAGVDHLEEVGGKADLVDGVVFQAETITAAGGIPIVLPMPWLPQNDATAEDYVEVYTGIVRRLDGPVLVHWLGPMFLPALEGYFPGDSFSRVMACDPDKVRGCKLSLLDAGLEQRVRRELLPRDQVVFTGDDFHFAGLVLGGDPAAPPAAPPEVQRWTPMAGQQLAVGDFSHALLGILDGIALPAGLALRCLDHGLVDRYREIMEPCEVLGQLVFAAPTRHYKAGLAFLAWLNGLQDDFTLVNREDRARSRKHLLAVAEQAARCGALRDAALAAERLRAFAEGAV